MTAIPVSPSLGECLATFEGRRALVIDDGRGGYLDLIAQRYDEAHLVQAFSAAISAKRALDTPDNVKFSAWQGAELPFAADAFDAVFLVHTLGRVTDRAALIGDCLRVLKQRAPLVALEFSLAVSTPRQINLLSLERLLRDRDEALRGEPLPWLASEDLQRELRALDLHHLRYLDISPEQTSGTALAELKRESLERIKLDLLPSLSRLGEQRDAFEHRLIEIKRAIELTGVAPLGHVLVYGVKKTVYAATEASLFASVPLTPEPARPAALATGADMPPLPASPAAAIETLSTGELLSLIFTGGESQSRLERLAARILREYGSRAVAAERNPQALVETFGIGYAQALQIVAAFELGRRFFAADADAPVLRGPEDIFQFAAEMGKLKREQFRGLYLDNRQRLVADEVISIGTLTSAILHPREVFRPAFSHNAVSMVLVHNHPSGDAEPSNEDIEMTRQLSKAGQILGIELLDHVIIGGDIWYSMKNASLF